jgi:hypothetical protein
LAALGELIEGDISTGGGIEMIDSYTLRNSLINLLAILATC